MTVSGVGDDGIGRVSMGEASSTLVTLLFTDLVGSTELLSRTGDEKARHI